jgi:hypothetical protein
LDNGAIRVGVSVSSHGGAIASGSSYNLVNNHDRGRQIQQSCHAGQLPDRRNEGAACAFGTWILLEDNKVTKRRPENDRWGATRARHPAMSMT